MVSISLVPPLQQICDASRMRVNRRSGQTRRGLQGLTHNAFERCPISQTLDQTLVLLNWRAGRLILPVAFIQSPLNALSVIRAVLR